MPRRSLPTALVLLLVAAGALAQGDGTAELARGREAFARQDYATAADHLSRATAALDPERDREALADAYLKLGAANLVGLGRPEPALAWFLASAGLGVDPATAYLWAAQAAEQLGRADEAKAYRARALAPPPRAAAPPAPAAPALDEAPPAPEPPAPAPEPTTPAAAVPEEKTDAFGHFFRRRGKTAAPPAEAPGAAKAAPAPTPPAAGEKAKPELTPQPESSEGDAFRYFFGKRQGKEPDEAKEPAGDTPPAEEEPPPGSS